MSSCTGAAPLTWWSSPGVGRSCRQVNLVHRSGESVQVCVGKKQTSVFSLRLRRLAGRVHSVSFECFPSDALGCYSRRMHWQSHPGREIMHTMNVKEKIIEDEHCSLSPHLTCCLQVWKHWKLLGHSWRSVAATSRPLALVGGSNSNWKQCANTWNWLCS